MMIEKKNEELLLGRLRGRGSSGSRPARAMTPVSEKG